MHSLRAKQFKLISELDDHCMTVVLIRMIVQLEWSNYYIAACIVIYRILLLIIKLTSVP